MSLSVMMADAEKLTFFTKNSPYLRYTCKLPIGFSKYTWV